MRNLNSKSIVWRNYDRRKKICNFLLNYLRRQKTVSIDNGKIIYVYYPI